MNDPQELRRLGAVIRQHRQAMGVSQEKFADMIEMHRAYYGAIERGSQNLTVTTMLRVCRGLNTPLSAIFRAAEL